MRSKIRALACALITAASVSAMGSPCWAPAAWGLPRGSSAQPHGAGTGADALKALGQQIRELYEQGHYDEAIPLAERYAAGVKSQLGEKHPDYATALNNLGMLLKHENRFAEAEQPLRRALAIKERALGAEHPDTAVALSNLGDLLAAMDRVAEAEPLMRHALAIKEKLGPERPETAVALNNLALLLSAANRPAEAEPLMRRALAIDEKGLGPDHPNVAIRLNNLAQLLQSANRIGEAEPLMRRSLAIKEKNFGPDHPSVATALNNLAELLGEGLGESAESERLRRRALAIYENSLGPTHPDVAAALNNLAALLENTGRQPEAEPLYRRALAIMEKAYGPEHSKVAIAVNNLAHLMKAGGRQDEAEPLMRRALAIDTKLHGSDHPDVARDLNNLAMLYEAMNRTADAEPLMRRAIAIDEKSRGPDHPQTAIDLNNLATLLVDSKRYAEAEPLLRRSLTIIEKGYGSAHPNLGAGLSNLAVLRGEQGDWADALAIMRRASAIAVEGARRLSGGETERALLRQNANQFRTHVLMAYRAASSDASVLDEAFAMAQRASISAASGALAQAGARFAAGDGALAKLVREQQDLAQRREISDRKLLAALGNGDKAGAEALRAEQARLGAEISRTAALTAKDFPDFALLANPEPLSVAAVQALLSPEEALVQFVDMKPLGAIPETAFAFAITRTEVRWVELPLGAGALAEQVDALRCGLDAAEWTDASTWPEGDAEERALKKVQQAKLARCAQLLGVAALQDDLPPFDLKRAHELYKALFGQIEDLIESKRLLIAPSPALTRLPLQTLVAEAPDPALKGFEAYAKAAWLGVRQPIALLPSAASLAILRGAGRGAEGPDSNAARKPFIGFGNPLLDGPAGFPVHQARAAQAKAKQSCGRAAAGSGAGLGASPAAASSRKTWGGWPMPASLFRGGLANVAGLREQIPLPETADELCSVSREFRAESDVWLGRRMTERNIKDLSERGELASYRVLHFATHGLLSGDLKDLAEPALMFTPPPEVSPTDDGLLTASEAAQLKLNADWVVMSACNTAAGGAEGAEALSGLARAFFYAGARALLVSHWSVDSDAAVAITTGAFAAMQGDPAVGRAEALRRSMRAVISDPAKAHPAIWAPFTLVGEGAR